MVQIKELEQGKMCFLNWEEIKLKGGLKADYKRL